jgi:hypothetical protein
MSGCEATTPPYRLVIHSYQRRLSGRFSSRRGPYFVFSLALALLSLLPAGAPGGGPGGLLDSRLSGRSLSLLRKQGALAETNQNLGVALLEQDLLPALAAD